MNKKFLTLLFAITALILAAEYFITEYTVYLTRNVVMTGTGVLALITLLTFAIGNRSSGSENPNKFVRGVMGATFLKFMLCVAAAGVYIFIEKKNIHKPDLFFLMFLYMIYTTAETLFLASLAKKNAQKP